MACRNESMAVGKSPLDLESFQSMQFKFSAHIRHPGRNPRPVGVEARRMQVYLDLVYNSIESFLANTFQVARKILDDEHWHLMVRDFIYRHTSTSPYFPHIPQEFLAYLSTEREVVEDPRFLLELCHYEWVEVALDLSAEMIPANEDYTDPIDQILEISPLAMTLRYDFPVHQIGPFFQPEIPPTKPTHLIVYRNREERVQFMESNIVTTRLLNLIREGKSVRASLQTISDELGRKSEQILEYGVRIVDRLIKADIILVV